MSSYSKWAEEEKRRRAGQGSPQRREPVSYEEKPYWRRLRSELPRLVRDEEKAALDYGGIADKLMEADMQQLAKVFRELSADENRHFTRLKRMMEVGL